MSHGDYDAFDYLDLLTGRLVEPRIGGPGYHEYRAAQAQVRVDYKTLIGNRTVWGRPASSAPGTGISTEYDPEKR
jgi:hypothetical protein